jgi:hypothetical protein
LQSSSPFARGLAALVAVTLVAQAQTVPSDVADLVGARGAGGETELGNRGYVNHHVSKTESSSYSYWWSAARKQCIRVQTHDGRYAQIVQTPNSDCNQKDADSGPSTGAKVALGAAALLGVVALAHKSHHRNDDKYDEHQTADFERGYRDGLYNHPYHNYGNAREYGQGFSAGVEERRQQSSYRHGNEYRGGYRAHVSIGDLDNQDAGYARSQLERRGFRRASDRRLGHDKHEWLYWNGSTRQCVKVHARDDRVRSIRDVDDADCN